MNNKKKAALPHHHVYLQSGFFPLINLHVIMAIQQSAHIKRNLFFSHDNTGKISPPFPTAVIIKTKIDIWLKYILYNNHLVVDKTQLLPTKSKKQPREKSNEPRTALINLTNEWMNEMMAEKL